ncbi:MAG: BsuBI/PstI family type II restriction endonuclease [Actinomycetota bacterium]|nr:BsuBI/PstI family type II restriction endonuclease [Actinomycetota bacterium]
MNALDSAGVRTGQAIMALKDLGLPAAQQNERTALALLALLGMTPETPWADAATPMLGITQMMAVFRDHWGKDYAPNTRETVRRQSVHQLIAAGVLVQNPDDPTRPVNSGKNVYQVTPEAFSVLTAFGTDAWAALAKGYREEVGSLVERWAMERYLQRIAVTLPNGEAITLSPGGQNPVIVAVIQEFCSRYTPGGHVLYIGDADDKWVVREDEALRALAIDVDEHGKMPDVVIHDVSRGWLILVEAVTSHGPMDAKRVDELNRLFASSTAGLVFVTAFPDRATFKRWAGDLSWETEVWLVAEPSHMIHFNGDRYLGPHERTVSDFMWNE